MDAHVSLPPHVGPAHRYSKGTCGPIILLLRHMGSSALLRALPRERFFFVTPVGGDCRRVHSDAAHPGESLDACLRRKIMTAAANNTAHLPAGRLQLVAFVLWKRAPGVDCRHSGVPLRPHLLVPRHPARLGLRPRLSAQSVARSILGVSLRCAEHGRKVVRCPLDGARL